MKKYFSIIILSLCLLPGFSQVYLSQQASAILPSASKVWMKESATLPSYIEFTAEKRLTAADTASQLKALLSLQKEATLKPVRRSSDKMGYQHTRYQLCYNRIPVEGAIINLHMQFGRMHSANGQLYSLPGITTKPALSAKEAEDIARENSGGDHFYTNQTGIRIDPVQLVILPVQNEFFLCYRVDVFTKEPLSRNYVYVDALNGKVIKQVSRLHYEAFQGTAETKYQGTQTIMTESEGTGYKLTDQSRGVFIATLDMNAGTDYATAINFLDQDNYWDDKTDQDDAATNAHFAVQKAFDFYKEKFNRHSFDDQGADIISYIHFDEHYVNAFWNGSGFAYGDGDGTNYSALTPLDVVAHEYTHAVTQYTAGLEYAFESGALNESFSDIFGVAIDFFSNADAANYLLGEQFSMYGNASRDMSDPQRLHHPDTYKGAYWITGTQDNGGVHTNSGVQNYWFYLLAEGGSGTNDLGQAYSVNGIGREKATAIAYRNLTVYLTPYAQYLDARFYAIQAARDLFGDCSPEVIAVTNAWHAVGVGEKFSENVMADFQVSRSYSCQTPVVINFSNASVNAGSFSWSFGDGGASSDPNPSHTYTEEGSYTVQLIATGQNTCSGSDTLIREAFIQIHSSDDLMASVCAPNTSYPAVAGISEFEFKTLRTSSALAEEEGAYVDRSCEFSVDLIAGELVDINVLTGPKDAENVAIWIDLNNNGYLSPDERLWESENQLRNHSGQLIIPAPSVYNQPLRLRLAADIADYPITDACGTLHSGQMEDYRVVIHENTLAPDAGFRLSNKVVGEGELVQLFDYSLNLPTQWNWEMEGGNPSFSTTQNTEVSYDQPGRYPVVLKVSNAYGNDSIAKRQAIEVLPSSIMGTDISGSDESGLLYDAGGPEGKYQNDEIYTFLIEPACAQSVRIKFYEFLLENSFDYLYIYDGQDETGELLLEATGHTLPGEVVATSGKAYIVFESDFSTQDYGFKLRWDADLPPNEQLSANFMMSDSIPAFIERIRFEDLSSHGPVEWLWSFGDGHTSTEKNPEHVYTSSGLKEVKLYASNCFFSDTLIKTISVLPPPEIQVNPGSISDVLMVDDTKNYALNISNASISGVLQHSLLIREDTKLSFNSAVSFAGKKSVSKAEDTEDNLKADKARYISFGQSEKLTPTSLNYSQVKLEKALSLFSEGSKQLSKKIPHIYYFEEGIQGTMISDGGDDMYDGGNYLSTNFQAGIVYSNDSIQDHSAFGAGGSYFTLKQPGLFLLAANLDGVTEISITGNLGADGKGSVDANIIRMDRGMQSYTGFVKRVYGTSDPSVNHLIIIPNADKYVSHSIDINTNSDGHVIENLQYADRLYYLLFASEEGGYIPDSIMANIMNSFIDLIEPECSWLQTDSKIMSVDALSSGTQSLTVNTTGLIPGNYAASIHVISNDTSNRELIIPFKLKVEGNCQIALTAAEHLGQTYTGTTLADTSWVVNRGTETLVINGLIMDGEAFSAELQNHIIAPGDSAMLLLFFAPAEAGEDSAMLTITSNAMDMEVVSFRIGATALQAPAPWVLMQPEALILYLGGESFEILLDTLFADTSGGSLGYDISLTDGTILQYSLNENQLILEQLTLGSTRIELIATNQYGESASILFTVIVMEPNDRGTLSGGIQLTAYPNPATDYIIIGGIDIAGESVYFVLLNSQGQVLKADTYKVDPAAQSIRVDLSQLVTGVYILYLEYQGKGYPINIIKE